MKMEITIKAETDRALKEIADAVEKESALKGMDAYSYEALQFAYVEANAEIVRLNVLLTEQRRKTEEAEQEAATIANYRDEAIEYGKGKNAENQALKAENAHLNQLLQDQDEKAAQVHDAYEKAIEDIREHEKGLTVKDIAEAYKSGLIWLYTRCEGKPRYLTKQAEGRLSYDMEKILYHNADKKVKSIDTKLTENYFPILVVEIE